MKVEKLSIVLVVFVLLAIQSAIYAGTCIASADSIDQELEASDPNSSDSNFPDPNVSDSNSSDSNFSDSKVSNPSSPEIEALIRDLNAPDLDVKENAVKALVGIGSPAVDPLILALESEDPDTRENAACALGKIGDENVIKPLILLLADEEWEVEKAANDALVAIGEPAVEPLILVLQDDNENVYLQLKVVDVLGELGDERAIQPMIQALKSGDPELRADLAYSLGMMGEPAVEPLIQVLGDEDPYVRVRAAEALGRIGDERAIGPLTEALDDDFERVRIFAKKGLEKIENQNKNVVIAVYGEKREFYIEDRRREWLDKLHSITTGARNDMKSYFYPAGPVISYGTSIENRIEVGILEGSDVNDSTLDEIYGIFDREGKELGIDEVPLVFKYEGPIREDEELVEETEAPTEASTEAPTKASTEASSEESIEDVKSTEGMQESRDIPGFKVMFTLLGVLVSACILKKR